MTTAERVPVPREPPSPPGSQLEALVDGLGEGPVAQVGDGAETVSEPTGRPGEEPPDT